jgi:hypothetical protein
MAPPLLNWNVRLREYHERKRIRVRAAGSVRMEGRIIVIVTLGVVLLVAPFGAGAEQTGKVPRVGFLLVSSRSDPTVQRAVDAFQQGLRERGYVEGQIAIEYRSAEGKYDVSPTSPPIWSV